MTKTTAILSLGTRPDAETWEKGCKALGFGAPQAIKSPEPTLAELKSLLALSPEWIFFGGHSYDYPLVTLGNEGFKIQVKFHADKVELETPSGKAVVRKGGQEFRLHEKVQVVLWGGCSVAASENTVRGLRALFGHHLILGFAGLTGWRIVDAMLGGGFIKNHFFARLGGQSEDLAKVRDAWMATAKDGYGGDSLETIFRAIDPTGQEWKLEKSKVVRGRNMP